MPVGCHEPEGFAANDNTRRRSIVDAGLDDRIDQSRIQIDLFAAADSRYGEGNAHERK